MNISNGFLIHLSTCINETMKASRKKKTKITEREARLPGNTW
jgi:hypothetical protein